MFSARLQEAASILLYFLGNKKREQGMSLFPESILFFIGVFCFLLENDVSFWIFD
jgi:hypothetical protein